VDKVEMYSRKLMMQLEKDVLPYIGKIPVSELKAPEVLPVCRP